MALPLPARRALFARALLGLAMATACSSPTTPTSPLIVDAPAAAPSLTIACPTAVERVATDPPIAITFPAPTVAGGTPPVQTSCTRASGSPFGPGTTQVQCTATDATARTVSCVFDVTVRMVAPRLSHTKFLAFGDSMTSGEISVPIPAGYRGESPAFQLIVVPAASYPTQLLARLRARYSEQTAVLEMVNGGLPGEWAADGAKRLPGMLNTVRPEAVLLLEGVNDIGSLGLTGVTLAASALDGMTAEARARGAVVFIATLVPPRPGGTHTVPTALVTAMNDRIRQIAAGRGAVVVDLYSAMLSGVSTYVGIDGLHPTEAGYQKIANEFEQAIRTNLEVRLSGLPATAPE